MSNKLFFTALVLVVSVIQSAQADEKRHRQLAEEYLELGGYKKQLEAMHKQSAELYVNTNQEFKDHQAAIQRAHGRVFSIEKIKPELVQFLTKHFTEGELVELIKFFKTPAGKKLTETLPEMSKTYAGLFRKLAANEALSKAIEEEIEKDKK